MMRYFSVLCFTIICNFVFSQSTLESKDEKLHFYGDVMVSALNANHRLFASEQFYFHFKEYLDSVNLYNYNFSDLRTLSLLQPDDNSFKLISWQIEKASYQYQYFAFLIFPDGKYVEFKDNQPLNNNIQYMDLAPDSWYGSLYYNMKKVDEGKYLLFGYNAFGQFDHVKLADYLIVDNDKVSLGSEVFEDRKATGNFVNRIYLQYSSDATVNLNYNPGLEMIIMDHLTPRMGKQDGQGPTMIPDGTYEGYELQDDRWKYVSKIYDHSYGENNAPRPVPVLDKKKNIFGQ